MNNKLLIAAVATLATFTFGTANAVELFNRTTDNDIATIPGTTITNPITGTTIYTQPPASTTTTGAGVAATTGMSGAAMLSSTPTGVSSGTATSASDVPSTSATMNVQKTGSTNTGITQNIAQIGAAASTMTPAQQEAQLKGLTSVTAQKDLQSGLVDPAKCAQLIRDGKGIHEQRNQQAAEAIANVSRMPSAEALSCTAGSQAIIANAFMDIFQSRGMQNKIFGLIGKDAGSFFQSIGMPEGLATQLIGQIGSTLVSALGIDKAISGIASSIGGALGGTIGGVLGGGVQKINVSGADCKVMEQVSKTPCVLSPNSPIRMKDSDGTSNKCIDYAVMGAILGAGTTAVSGGNVGNSVWNSVGGMISDGLSSLNRTN